LGEVEAVYDRASLVALPEEMRADYVEHLSALCPAVPRLLITLAYDQARMEGPPFAVSEEEVQELYEDRSSLVMLEANDVLADNERFREQGLDRLVEAVWRMGA